MVAAASSTDIGEFSQVSEFPRLRSNRSAGWAPVEIQYIDSPDFQEATDEAANDKEIVDLVLGSGTSEKSGPVDLPCHLQRMCESTLLTPEQEAALFREMNRLKWQAARLQESYAAIAPDRKTIKKINSLLDRAMKIRDHITQSNIRLVISIVKKYVTPQLTFDEMLSDGVLTLMQAVEKFDYSRGYRFSTYAYRSIVHGIFRATSVVRDDRLRFTEDADRLADIAPEDPSRSSMSNQLWEQLRGLTATMMDRLDRRERLIVRSRYALGSHRKVRTLQSLADRLGISKERVRQLEKRAVSKLNGMASEFNLEEALSGGSGTVSCM